MPTHPISDSSVKKEIVNRVVDSLMNRGPAPTRRTIALSCAAYVGNVLDNALNAVAKSGGLNLSFSQKDSCFAKCEDMLLEWSNSASKGPGDRSEGLAHGVAKTGQEKEKLGWDDVMTGVIGVYLKMDSVL
jgi:Golgi phosphoprotein 3